MLPTRAIVSRSMCSFEVSSGETTIRSAPGVALGQSTDPPARLDQITPFVPGLPSLHSGRRAGGANHATAATARSGAPLTQDIWSLPPHDGPSEPTPPKPSEPALGGLLTASACAKNHADSRNPLVAGARDRSARAQPQPHPHTVESG